MEGSGSYSFPHWPGMSRYSFCLLPPICGSGLGMWTKIPKKRTKKCNKIYLKFVSSLLKIIFYKDNVNQIFL